MGTNGTWLSIIMPAYNEAEIVGQVVADILNGIPKKMGKELPLWI